VLLQLVDLHLLFLRIFGFMVSIMSLLLLTLLLQLIHTERCGHDALLQHPRQSQELLQQLQKRRNQPKQSTIQQTEKEPYIVEFNIDAFTDPKLSILPLCEYIGQTHTINSQTHTCSSEDTMTTERIEYIKKVLDKATLTISKLITREHITFNLREITNNQCIDINIPETLINKYTTDNKKTSLLIFISFNICDFEFCTENTLGYAGVCKLHTDFTPIIGYINMFPQHYTYDDNDFDRILEIIIHESFHSMGFISWAMDPIQEIINGEEVLVLKTPALVKVANEHFGNDVNYVELEMLGGLGTRGSHFSKRAFNNEIMTGWIASIPSISRFTLAFFEDFLKYGVNYELADEFNWGKGLGRQFLLDCGSWPKTEGREGCDSSVTNSYLMSFDRSGGGSCTNTRVYMSGCYAVISTYSRHSCLETANTPPPPPHHFNKLL